MYFRYTIMAVGAVLALATTGAALSNWQPVSLSAFGFSGQLQLGCLLLLALISGTLAGWSLAQGMAVKQEKQDRKLQEWQTQDVKLMSQVQSDREKQLEAKIATLETALKSALKKS